MENEILTLKRQLNEFTQKKRSDCIWTGTKKYLRKRIEEELNIHEPNIAYKITEGISMIARPILNRRVAATFTESDVEVINRIFDGFVKVIKQEVS